MEKKIARFMNECRKNNRKRFDLTDLEKFVVDAYGGHDEYLKNGGYISVYKTISILKSNGEIKEIESSDYNGLNPPLKTRWQIIIRKSCDCWDKSKMLKLSDEVDFSYYTKNPDYKNDTEWEYINSIYLFMKSRDSREWVSLEERSLELFNDEKFLKNRKDKANGKFGILSRLGISHEDLKIKKYGEMFIYWNRGTSDIRNGIILENHSTFFSYKRIAEKRGDLFGFVPDILIYGEGKKIESSMSFLNEIADTGKVKLLYFGDVDSEGFGIYHRLKERYPEIDIKLQSEAYEHLIKLCERGYPLGEQKKNESHLRYFIDEIKEQVSCSVIEKLENIWNSDFRIPQELINYEYLLKVKK